MQVNIATPLKNGLVFQTEISTVMKGFDLAKKDDWIGGPPLIVTLALTKTL